MDKYQNLYEISFVILVVYFFSYYTIYTFHSIPFVILILMWAVRAFSFGIVSYLKTAEGASSTVALILGSISSIA
jgi:hypothetical protein